MAKPSPSSLGQLKIIVASTPKTGNTWLKHLLAELYGLPLRSLPLDPNQIDWSALGPRWIAHQHYLPEEALLEKAREQGVSFVTTVRHPADVFVSLAHHARRENLVSANFCDAGYMLNDPELFGPASLKFLERGFREHLHLSLLWQTSGRTEIVRYENLWQDPVHALTRVADAIFPMKQSRIRQAICACEIETMANQHPGQKEFFRKGGIGAWQKVLPQTFQRALRTVAPFPEQFRKLGYAMDAIAEPSAEPARLHHPFRKKNRFSNGAPISATIIQAYFNAPTTLSDRWPENLGTEPGSFWEWLNQPAAADPQSGRTFPTVTELAHQIYLSRPDVQKVFPDLFGQSRYAYIEWLLIHGFSSYGLTDSYGTAMLGFSRGGAIGLTPPLPFSDRLVFDNGVPVPFVALTAYYKNAAPRPEWWTRPLATGPGSFYAWLRSPAQETFAAEVTELAAHVYSLRGDVQSAFPSLAGSDREAFLDWFRAAG